MRLRTKIFLLALGATLLVGFTTAALFARSWQKIASGYGLSILQARLDHQGLNDSFEGWEIESREQNPRWVSAPPTDSRSLEKALAKEIAEVVAKTRLPEGCFEYTSKVQKGRRYFLAFRTSSDQASVRIIGLESASLLANLKPWAVPFLGILLAVIAVVGGVSFAVSAALDRDYAMIQRALENIGAGRLKDLMLPTSQDPSIQSLSLGLKNLSRVLDQKDQQISDVSSMAYLDPMTGIPNYRAFARFADELLAAPAAEGNFKALAILDVDFFKKVNDTYGHPVGDFVLKEVARMLRETLRSDPSAPERPSDFFARYGGEEFVIVMPKVDPALAQTAPLRILNKLKSTRLHVPPGITEKGESVVISITASFGLAIWESGWTREQWVKEADQGLYNAKKNGRARVVRLRPSVAEWTG